MQVWRAVAVFCLMASASLAQSKVPVSPLDSVERLSGAIDVRGEDQKLVVIFHGLDSSRDRIFEIETFGREEQLPSFHSDYAQLLFWRGHLVVTADREREAMHFSVPGFDKPPAPSADGAWREATSDLPALDRLLGARYHFTRIGGATGILSKAGPQALRPTADKEVMTSRSTIDPYNPDPGSGVGNGNCGVSCSTTCGDGSTCNISCGPNRCAFCSCPLLCQCK